ncbi:CAAX prenyl protease 1 [Apiospora hydei]|uniref:CAAX prenyl protease 1 n=1 Tax=Apiospora hydei TaxID=1337664 RepID=A0ABR1W8X3_9PEZI
MGPLKNSNLLEHRLPSEDYNALSRIDECKLEPLKHREAHNTLLNLIAGHGLSDKFSIHLVHKHFDVPQDKVMVYEKVKGGKTPDFVIMTPRDPKAVPAGTTLRGLYFKTTPDNKMQAYEYTTAPATDLSAHEDFVKTYATLANGLGVGHVFALGAEGIATIETPLAEFEMGPYLSTVLVETESLPGLEEMSSSVTGWKPADAGNDGSKVQDKALTGTGMVGGTIYPEVKGQMLTTCIASRSGSHCYHGKPTNSSSVAAEDDANTSLSGTGMVGGTIYPEVKGQMLTTCIDNRAGNHCYHGKPVNPSTTAAEDHATAPLTGTGKAGDTIYPEVKGQMLTTCIDNRAGNHCYHGKPSSSDFVVETRQSMSGMSKRIGQSDVEVHPGIRVGDLPVIKDSVIHDVLDRAVQAIKAY